MKNAKPTLLLIGDGAAPTGFSRVLHYIGHSLIKDYEVHQLAINYTGDPHDLPWKLYPAKIHGDVYGVNRLQPLIESIKPQIVLTLADLHTMVSYAKIFRQYRKSIITIGYFPVDGAPMSHSIVEGLLPYDHLVAFNQFGADTMAQAIKEASQNNDEIFVRNLATIPHGVEKDAFFPLDGKIGRDRSEAKKRLFPDTEEFRNSFIVLNGNRNQPRKGIDITMKGFALFACDKPKNVKLYLHMGTRDLGWDIIELATRLGIDDRLLLTSKDPAPSWENQTTQNLIYNACEVGINTSLGEGWGLVSFEHAATGACQIVPNHTGPKELWKDDGILLTPSFSTTNTSLMTENYHITEQTVAGALENVYQNDRYREEMSAKAFKMATQNNLEWLAIGNQWRTYLREALMTHPAL